MSDTNQNVAAAGDVGDADSEFSDTYKKPAEVSVKDMLEKDKEDESLEKMKKALLGETMGSAVIDETNPSRLIPHKLILVPQDRDPIEFDLIQLLSGDSSKEVVTLDKVIKLKEATEYKIHFHFQVQREIIMGLRLAETIKKGIISQTNKHVMGCFSPKLEVQVWKGPSEIAPSGMMARGTYKIHSKFTDDDGHEYPSFKWTLEISKDW